MAHDYKKFPELTNQKLETEELTSPHIQIKNDFPATVSKVVDGDTVRLACAFRDFSFPLRILGIDAPEMNAGGEEAKEFLKGWIEGEEVEIKIDRRQRVGKYGRLLGKILYAGLDMGEMMISMGHAVRFGERRESQIPPSDKVFDMKQWF